jgi:hypothetical protein
MAAGFRYGVRVGDGAGVGVGGGVGVTAGVVGGGVVGATVGVSVGLGVGVRGVGVTDGDGEELGDGVGLTDGAASCCEEITAAPRASRAIRATAAKTVKTVDQRSAGRRCSTTCGEAAADGGGEMRSVSSGSLTGGFSSTCHPSARAVPNGRMLDRSLLRRNAPRATRCRAPKEGPCTRGARTMRRLPDLRGSQARRRPSGSPSCG